MKIAPIFLSNNQISNRGKVSEKAGFKAQTLLNYNNSNDVFTRMAIASTRDKALERDLYSMGLI